MKRLVLAGGSGFLGQALGKHFAALGYEVVVLTRSPKSSGGVGREVAWDGKSLGDWVKELEGADTVINLSGRSVDCRLTRRNQKMILDSRLEPTRVLGEAFAKCDSPPRVWMNSGTATIYKHSLTKPMDEEGGTGSTPEAQDAFSVHVAREWERVFLEARTPQTRKVVLRTTMVLGHAKNSVFPVLCRLVRLGLGGAMASGKQFVAWIHQADFCAAIEWLMAMEDLSGPVNIAAPYPVTNREMMETLRKVLGRSFGLPAKAWMIEIGAFFLQTEPELVIKSRYVVPGRLLASGFQFQFPTMRGAFKDLSAEG